MIFEPTPLSWEEDGKDWPNRQASQFVLADRVRFHVQVLGSGPALLLLHGTGASGHSWRDLVPELSKQFTLVIPDLPGHSFSSMPGPGKVSLSSYAALFGSLMRELGVVPVLAVGHSAGAAIAARMAMDDHMHPKSVISFNGAFAPMGGVAGQLFSPLAKLLTWNPLAPRIFAWRARDVDVVRNLIVGTGSHLSDEGIGYYQRLMCSPAHASGALSMMANWDLTGFQNDLTSLKTRMVFVVGANDRAVPSTVAREVADENALAEFIRLEDLGHLAHEEDPRKAADIIKSEWRSVA